METISDSYGVRGSVESLIGGRKENQDSYGMADTRLGLLVVVCDGMGGGPAGKTASSIAVQSIIDYVSGADINQSPLSILTDAVVSANEAILAAVAQNPALNGMGTTCVGVLIGKNEAYIVHVGDSRCYQLRGDKVVFRTADHSYVGELVRRGTMTEEEARNSKYSNVITRAIGVAAGVEPELDTVTYHPGDRFALMTDGIWGTLPENQLIKFISQHTDPAVLVPTIAKNIDTLGIDNGGGHDNLTLAIVDIPTKKGIIPGIVAGTAAPSAAPAKPVQAKAATKATAPTPKSKDKKESAPASQHKKSNAVSITLIIATAVVICFAFFLYFQSKTDTPPAEATTTGNSTAEQTQTVEVPVDQPTDTPEQTTGTTTEQQTTPKPEPQKPENTIAKVLNAVETAPAAAAEVKDVNQPTSETATQSEPQKVQTPASKPETPHLQAALSKLNDIVDKKLSDKKKGKEKVQEEISNALESVMGILTKASDSTTDQSIKNEIEAIRKIIYDNKKTMSSVDKKECHPTSDALKLLMPVIDRIKKLIK